VTASYLVDASGRGAPATAVHIPGRRWLRADRLVALVGKFTGTRPIEPVLVLEAAEEGWWYSVPQPDGALLAVLVTDADLLPARGRTALGHHFLAGVSRAPHTAERAAGGELASAPWIARSESGTLLPGRGRAWCALGDAAIGCDPLAGDGVTRALKAAFDAAPEIDRELAGDETAAAAANERLRERFGDYLDLRARYYEHEPRWRDALFWARRRSVDWREAPLLLDPRHLLRWNGTVPSREALAPVEALIPYGALRKLFEQKQPTGAHEALAQLRAAAPVGDRRLLVGLQLAAALGCVAVES
jgi:2-polyprenyl-6-methoxyphenol hydroxylase-like FAD-dependent oxidoreductase